MLYLGQILFRDKFRRENIVPRHLYPYRNHTQRVSAEAVQASFNLNLGQQTAVGKTLSLIRDEIPQRVDCDLSLTCGVGLYRMRMRPHHNAYAVTMEKIRQLALYVRWLLLVLVAPMYARHDAVCTFGGDGYIVCHLHGVDKVYMAVLRYRVAVCAVGVVYERELDSVALEAKNRVALTILLAVEHSRVGNSERVKLRYRRTNSDTALVATMVVGEYGNVGAEPRQRIGILGGRSKAGVARILRRRRDCRLEVYYCDVGSVEVAFNPFERGAEVECKALTTCRCNLRGMAHRIARKEQAHTLRLLLNDGLYVLLLLVVDRTARSECECRESTCCDNSVVFQIELFHSVCRRWLKNATPFAKIVIFLKVFSFTLFVFGF